LHIRQRLCECLLGGVVLLPLAEFAIGPWMCDRSAMIRYDRARRICATSGAGY
jgi:hypothetical protein